MKLIVQTSLSRKRSHKSARSSFMSKLMTLLGGDPGNAISNAFVKPDAEEFKNLMSDIVDKMAKSIKRTPPKVEASGMSDDVKLLTSLFPKAKRKPDSYTYGGTHISYTIVEAEPRDVVKGLKAKGWKGSPTAGVNAFYLVHPRHPGIRIEVNFAEDLDEDDAKEWGISEEGTASMVAVQPLKAKKT